MSSLTANPAWVVRLLGCTAVALCVIACSDDGGAGAQTDTDVGAAQTGTSGSSASTSSPSSSSASTATPTTSTDPSNGTTSDDPGTDASTGDETGDIDPPPTSSACADRELPPRAGAEIVVSPGGPGMVTVDGNASTLRDVVNSANAGDTVLLEDGTYTFIDAADGDFTGVFFTTPDITLRSMSGDPTAVILDSEYVSHGGQSAPITIDASGVVVADLTVTRSVFHLIHIWSNGDGALIHNVHMIDGGQQFLKSSVNDGTVDGVEVSCTNFLMTDAGRDNVWGYGPQDGGTACYTGGIDTHNATNWNIHDSYFDGIYCDATGVQRPAHGRSPEARDNMTYNGGLAEHGIHMWDSAQGTGHTIARNRVVNCARGIGLGLTDTVYGSSVVNNMVFSEFAGAREHDVGIIVERGVDTLVAHNSVYFSHAESYPRTIEYRWDVTNNLTVDANVTNREVAARDGAVASGENVLGADPTWFADAASGDLHLADCSGPGQVPASPDVTDDFDGDPRSDLTAPGADECAR